MRDHLNGNDATTATPSPHSRAWYARVARELGGRYAHPWQWHLNGPSGEDTYTALLDTLLTPRTRVLEAGCGHGLDAARYARRVHAWVGYDFTAGFLDTARREVSEASFVQWNSSRDDPPAELGGPFGLIVSRRGPTSITKHLKRLAAPGAVFLGVGAGGDELAARVRKRLLDEGVSMDAEWLVRTPGILPAWQDYARWCEFNDATPSRAEWASRADERGFPFVEERYVWLARVP